LEFLTHRSRKTSYRGGLPANEALHPFFHPAPQSMSVFCSSPESFFEPLFRNHRFPPPENCPPERISSAGQHNNRISAETAQPPMSSPPASYYLEAVRGFSANSAEIAGKNTFSTTLYSA
jgi:hypothetical protein